MPKCNFNKISQNSQENTCVRAAILIKNLMQFYWEWDLGAVVSCEFREIFKNAFFTELL